MNAEAIARALGGRKVGQGWAARCPAHDDQNPSLSICDADGKVLVHCHAGCAQSEVISALREKRLWGGGDSSSFLRPKNPVGRTTASTPADPERSASALSIWNAATSAEGTRVVDYLAFRGITIPPPSALRFHHLKHRSGGILPCMVALVSRGTDGAPVAIHRTFLACGGAGKAPVDHAKMMLGPCRGGAVCLGDIGEVLMIGEGIETCLSVMQATGHPAWAALSTSGLRALELPQNVRDVIVLADGDDPGEAAARDCALRWKGEGRRVRIARAPRGLDFNDVLVGRAPERKGRCE